MKDLRRRVGDRLAGTGATLAIDRLEMCQHAKATGGGVSPYSGDGQVMLVLDVLSRGTIRLAQTIMPRRDV